MKIGLSLSGDQITLEEILQFARQAEANGFDSLWVPEAWREAFVPLTAIALQTSRVRIGTAIALAMARSPVLLVDQVAIAGTPQECRDKLAQHEGLVDELIITSASFGLSREEIVHNYQHILTAFL